MIRRMGALILLWAAVAGCDLLPGPAATAVPAGPGSSPSPTTLPGLTTVTPLQANPATPPPPPAASTTPPLPAPTVTPPGAAVSDTPAPTDTPPVAAVSE